LIDVLPFYSCSVRCNIIIRAISVAIKTIDQLRRNRFRKDPPDARLLFTGMRSRNFQTSAVSHPVHFEVISQEHWSRAPEDQGFSRPALRTAQFSASVREIQILLKDTARRVSRANCDEIVTCADYG